MDTAVACSHSAHRFLLTLSGTTVPKVVRMAMTEQTGMEPMQMQWASLASEMMVFMNGFTKWQLIKLYLDLEIKNFPKYFHFR